MTSETLLASKAALENSSLFKKWVRDNPNESARIEAYWRTGGVFPQTATAFGLHYALDAKAYHESLPISRVLLPPSAGAGADVAIPDGVDVAIFPLPAAADGPRVGALVLDPHLPFVPV